MNLDVPTHKDCSLIYSYGNSKQLTNKLFNNCNYFND